MGGRSNLRAASSSEIAESGMTGGLSAPSAGSAEALFSCPSGGPGCRGAGDASSDASGRNSAPQGAADADIERCCDDEQLAA